MCLLFVFFVWNFNLDGDLEHKKGIHTRVEDNRNGSYEWFCCLFVFHFQHLEPDMYLMLLD